MMEGNRSRTPPAAGSHASTGLYVRGSRGLRLRDQRVRKLVQRMRAVMPWLEPADMPAARAWAELEYLAGQVYAVLRGEGVLNPKGEARRLLDDYRKLRQTQIILSRELGMTPAARMAIKATGTRAALDLAAAMARAEETEPAGEEAVDGATATSSRERGAGTANRPTPWE